MREYLNIGSTPCDESCAQVGDENYREKARLECERFIKLIRKVLGDEPTGAQLSVKSFPHDFGSYLEVVCYYDTENEESVDYAYRCESDSPTTWEGENV